MYKKDLKDCVLKKKLYDNFVCFKWNNKIHSDRNLVSNIHIVDAKNHKISEDLKKASFLLSFRFELIFLDGISANIQTRYEMFEFVRIVLENRG